MSNKSEIPHVYFSVISRQKNSVLEIENVGIELALWDRRHEGRERGREGERERERGG